MNTQGHTTMKRILLPLAIALAAFTSVGLRAQDVSTRSLILREPIPRRATWVR